MNKYFLNGKSLDLYRKIRHKNFVENPSFFSFLLNRNNLILLCLLIFL